MKTSSWGCGCFLKVYVCPEHLDRAGKQLELQAEAMRDQLDLGLDLAGRTREGREAEAVDDLPF